MNHLSKIGLTLAFAATIHAVHGQNNNVGIGTNSPNAGAILELSATDKAFLPPRLTTAARNLIASPVEGMTIFNTTTSCTEWYSKGAWYNPCNAIASISGKALSTGRWAVRNLNFSMSSAQLPTAATL